MCRKPRFPHLTFIKLKKNDYLIFLFKNYLDNIIIMESIAFIENFIEKIDTIRNEEFTINNFVYEEKIIEKKKLNENLKEFKNFQSNIKKQALLDKSKPSNVGKKEYGSACDNNVDILEDDIFNNNVTENSETEIKLDIELLERDKKLGLISDFLQRKNIILDESEIKKIEDIVDDPNISLKKYITISKLYQQIIKIGFIKKLENGSYLIDINQNKPKKTKNYFFK